ncbi:MurR/RpiR family transcriptional regulator [Companilactobacillus kimchiensis]|uniref:Transcription regulator n=1 Tax=Companilactobacillus kimchiensis TaxID=993692 RepID=A0A0R2LGX8_9LACO|nr:MurR/RpiR family transcriptional regulator [Companilactobacillus kimchiensis]KRN98764.1 transcription regulator [Companilactobacillus kimchiensis]
MVNTILLTIRSKMETASKTEKVLGSYILDNVQNIPGLSVAELSKRSGVSQATVVRFAQNLGVDGFKGLKVELARCSVDDVTNGLYDEISPDDGVDELKEKLVVRIQHTLETTSNGLNKQILQKTVDQLVAANMIQVYGLGASNLVAEDFTQKFARIGINIFNTQDTHVMASNFLTQQNKQVLFLVSDSGETNETLTLAKLARKKDITVISLTSNEKSRLAQISNIHILTSDTIPKDQIRSAATTSLISQLYAVDLIYYLYLQRDYDSNVQKLKETHLLVDEFFSRKK